VNRRGNHRRHRSRSAPSWRQFLSSTGVSGDDLSAVNGLVVPLRLVNRGHRKPAHTTLQQSSASGRSARASGSGSSNPGLSSHRTARRRRSRSAHRPPEVVEVGLRGQNPIGCGPGRSPVLRPSAAPHDAGTPHRATVIVAIAHGANPAATATRPLARTGRGVAGGARRGPRVPTACPMLLVPQRPSRTRPWWASLGPITISPAD